MLTTYVPTGLHFAVANDLMRIDTQRVMCNHMVGVINGGLSENIST